MVPTQKSAERLDAADPLAQARKKFVLPNGIVYLDGNSLGALPASVPETIQRVVVDQWGNHLIRAWNDDDWWGAPLRVGDRIGRLLGAAAGQTVVGESTSVQIFNALAAAARLRPERRLMIVDAGSFPTDRYLAGSVAALLGLEVLEVAVPDFADAIRAHGARVAVVTSSAVDYRSGELWDLGRLTAVAHEVGAVTVWDLCHAVGAVPLTLDADGVDIAVGCTYKYLSGGPGAPAFIYVAWRHQDDFDHPLTGWHGHARPFDMQAGFLPAQGISRARIGTPHVLSLLALDAALDVFDDVDMAAVREKSCSLGEFFIACVDELLADLGFELVTPREPERRGSQVTLRHPDAKPIIAALLERGFIGDVRPSNLLRFGFNALYVSHVDIFDTVEEIGILVASGDYRAPRFQVPTVIT